nr:hypothetical protein CFP56_02949 [Quercus suber]
MSHDAREDDNYRIESRGSNEINFSLFPQFQVACLTRCRHILECTCARKSKYDIVSAAIYSDIRNVVGAKFASTIRPALGLCSRKLRGFYLPHDRTCDTSIEHNFIEVPVLGDSPSGSNLELYMKTRFAGWLDVDNNRTNLKPFDNEIITFRGCYVKLQLENLSCTSLTVLSSRRRTGRHVARPSQSTYVLEARYERGNLEIVSIDVLTGHASVSPTQYLWSPSTCENNARIRTRDSSSSVFFAAMKRGHKGFAIVLAKDSLSSSRVIIHPATLETSEAENRGIYAVLSRGMLDMILKHCPDLQTFSVVFRDLVNMGKIFEVCNLVHEE